MKLKSFIIDNYKKIDHLEYGFGNRQVIPVIGGLESGKSSVIDALKLITDLITFKDFTCYDNAYLKVVLENTSTEDFAYEVKFKCGEIKQERFLVNDNVLTAVGDEEVYYPTDSHIWSFAKSDEHSSIFSKAIYDRVKELYGYHAFVDFFKGVFLLTPEPFYFKKFPVGNLMLTDRVQLNHHQFKAIEDLMHSAKPDLSFEKVIDNGDTDNFCSIFYKGRSIDEYSINVRMALCGLVNLQYCTRLLADDVNQEVLKVINNHLKDNQQMIFTGYKPIIFLNTLEMGD